VLCVESVKSGIECASILIVAPAANKSPRHFGTSTAGKTTPALTAAAA
jgi:hypothetical protein